MSLQNYNNFSFIVPESLAGMALPGRAGNLTYDLEFLAKQGIKAIVTLTESSIPENHLQKEKMEYLHIPIPDFSPPSLAEIEKFIAFAEKMIEQKKAVLVHCYAGIGRTGTMLACYLVKQGMGAQEAILEVRRRRPGSIETSKQEEIIWAYQGSIS